MTDSKNWLLHGRPFSALFDGPPVEWRKALLLRPGQALRTANGCWLYNHDGKDFSEYAGYGAQLDVVRFDAKLQIKDCWSDYPTNFIHIKADQSLPPEMASDLIQRTEANYKLFKQETTEPGARNSDWVEWGPCEACATEKSYVRIFEDINLFRCQHCGRWAERVVETERDMRRHRADFDWEKALPLMDGDKWMKSVPQDEALEMIRERQLGVKGSALARRKELQETAERSFRLPRRLPIEDVWPLAEQLFESLGLSFEPYEKILKAGMHEVVGQNGMKVIWVDEVSEDFGFNDAIGATPHRVFARIEMPPCSIGFHIFANKLDAFDVSGPIEEVQRIAAAIKRISSL